MRLKDQVLVKCPDCLGEGTMNEIDFDTGTHYDVPCITCCGLGKVDREWLESAQAGGHCL